MEISEICTDLYLTPKLANEYVCYLFLKFTSIEALSLRNNAVQWDIYIYIYSCNTLAMT